MSDRIFVGSDHAGFALKKSLFNLLTKEFPSLEFDDLGCDSEDRADYPDYARAVAEKVSASGGKGLLVCGSGIGMAIAANKVKGVRAANIWDATSARLSREHNDSNVMCLGARLTGPEVALEACRVWLSTDFQGGRHLKRVELIRTMEKET